MKMTGVYSKRCGPCGRNEKCYAPSKVSDWLSETKVFRFEQVWLLAMYRGKLSTALFPCCPVISETLRKKTHIEKKILRGNSLFLKKDCANLGF